MKRDVIGYKINPVPDEVCRQCSQLWAEACRAYLEPHSEEEWEHRKDGIIKCTERRKEVKE